MAIHQMPAAMPWAQKMKNAIGSNGRRKPPARLCNSFEATDQKTTQPAARRAMSTAAYATLCGSDTPQAGGRKKGAADNNTRARPAAHTGSRGIETVGIGILWTSNTQPAK